MVLKHLIGRLGLEGPCKPAVEIFCPSGAEEQRANGWLDEMVELSRFLSQLPPWRGSGGRSLVTQTVQLRGRREELGEAAMGELHTAFMAHQAMKDAMEEAAQEAAEVEQEEAAAAPAAKRRKTSQQAACYQIWLLNLCLKMCAPRAPKASQMPWCQTV